MYWIEMEKPEGIRIPKWQRSAAISDEGVVFIPGSIAGSEQEVLLCTAYKGTSVVNYLNHIYVPAAWLAKEFPETKEICELIAARVKEIYDSSKEGSD